MRPLCRSLLSRRRHRRGQGPVGYFLVESYCIEKRTMHNDNDRGGHTRSYQTMGDPNSRPASHDAFAFGIATEAMRNAAEAMTRAAAAMDTRSSINLQNLLPTSPTSSSAHLLGTPPDIPHRSSSMDHPPEKPQAAYLGHPISQSSLKTPLDYPRRQPNRQNSHMDLLEAVNMHDPRTLGHEKSYSRFSQKSYGEEVADRNMGGSYDARSRSSSLPLAAPSTPPLSSFDPEPPEDEHGHGHSHWMSLPHEIMFKIGRASCRERVF